MELYATTTDRLESHPTKATLKPRFRRRLFSGRLDFLFQECTPFSGTKYLKLTQGANIPASPKHDQQTRSANTISTPPTFSSKKYASKSRWAVVVRDIPCWVVPCGGVRLFSRTSVTKYLEGDRRIAYPPQYSGGLPVVPVEQCHPPIYCR